jgi:hypothetical protein
MQVKQTYSRKTLRQDIPASLRDSWRWLCASQQSGGISLPPPPITARTVSGCAKQQLAPAMRPRARPRCNKSPCSGSCAPLTCCKRCCSWAAAGRARRAESGRSCQQVAPWTAAASSSTRVAAAPRFMARNGAALRHLVTVCQRPVFTHGPIQFSLFSLLQFARRGARGGYEGRHEDGAATPAQRAAGGGVW